MAKQTFVERTLIEAWIRRRRAALEALDLSAFGAGLHPQVSFTWGSHQWKKAEHLLNALKSYHTAWRSIRLYLRHILIDEAQALAAIEWVGRTADNDNKINQILGGTVLQFNEAGLLTHCRTYLDPIRSRTVTALHKPWPEAGWTPSQDPGPPPTRLEAEQVVQANAQAWSSHDVSCINQVIHDEICICPPWDYQVGRASVEKGAQTYFNNYTDTQVTPHRLIFDPTQPYFGVCEQTFACTNPETGQRGADADFAFFEIAQGKLRYWRTYFDTSQSVQVIEKTAGYFQEE